jgi:hypothetical protein
MMMAGTLRVMVQPCHVWGLIPQPMRLLPNQGLRGVGEVIVGEFFRRSVMRYRLSCLPEAAR